MNAPQIIRGLERMGCVLTADNGKIRGEWRDMRSPPPESVNLIAELRRCKGEALDELICRTFTVITPCDGDLHEIARHVTDEGQLMRWAVAVRAGLIHLTGKVRVGRQSGQCRISFRCAMPLSWLEDAITTECKARYNAVLERIHRGAAWLRGNESAPDYKAGYERFLGLYEDLRRLYCAVGEALEDPLAGYPV